MYSKLFVPAVAGKCHCKNGPIQRATPKECTRGRTCGRIIEQRIVDVGVLLKSDLDELALLVGLNHSASPSPHKRQNFQYRCTFICFKLPQPDIDPNKRAGPTDAS